MKNKSAAADERLRFLKLMMRWIIITIGIHVGKMAVMFPALSEVIILSW